MPAPTIRTGTWIRGQESAFVDAVQKAIQSSLETPVWDNDIVLHLYEDNCRQYPSNTCEKFTRVEILMFEGRSLEIKKLLYRQVTDAISSFGVPPEHIHIILVETGLHNWGIRNAKMASEVNLGFIVNR